MSFSLLLLGFLFGLRHALEADHVAAVAYFASRTTDIRQAARHGAVWGMGHTLTLFLFGSVVLLVDGVVPTKFASALEFAVGVMLVGLGLDLLRRLWRDRVHFHTHRHGKNLPHFHAHSHAGEGEHDSSDHNHQHEMPRGALYVGLLHGMAGSAALIILTLQTVTSVLEGVFYIALFGVGSIIGMAVLSVVIAVPLRYSSRSITGFYNTLQTTLAVITLGIGVWMMVDQSQVLFV
ncbi:MAG: urease accessory protein [Pseudomonadota bacterium]